MSIPDSNISLVDDFGFVQYDIPLNALFYVKMTKKWYMNAALGPAVGYKPSSVGTIAQPGGKHEFINIGLVAINKKINIDYVPDNINTHISFCSFYKRSITI